MFVTDLGLSGTHLPLAQEHWVDPTKKRTKYIYM